MSQMKQQSNVAGPLPPGLFGRAANPQAGGGKAVGQTGAAPGQQGTPAYVPGSAQLNPATIAGPTAVNAPQMGTNWGYNVSQVDPSQFAASITQANSGLFSQQDQAVKEQLAQLGISGGADIGALANLGIQQESQQTGELAPTIANIDLANAGALNQEASSAMGLDYNAQNANVNNSIGTQEFNSSAQQQNRTQNANIMNQASEFNIGNNNTVNTDNANIFNQQLTNDQAMKNQDWLAELGSNTSIDTGQMEGSIQAYDPVFQAASSGGALPGMTINYTPTPATTPNPPDPTTTPYTGVGPQQ
jgi:hypothetical protein